MCFDLLDELKVVVEANPSPEKNICDYSACNGLELETQINGKSVIFGQCQHPLDYLSGDCKEIDKFCFVDEDSVCPKVPSKLKPGSFISTKPCEDNIYVTKNDEFFGQLLGFHINCVKGFEEKGIKTLN